MHHLRLPYFELSPELLKSLRQVNAALEHKAVRRNS